MHYLVYQTTNKLNGKRYIGAHRTPNIDDGYMGSGRLLAMSIRKYGLENFTREILGSYPSSDEMFAAEIRLIVEMKPEYNIAPGGKGGGWIGMHSEETLKKLRKPKSEETRRKMSAAATGNRSAAGKPKSEEARNKMSAAWIRRRLIPVSNETRKKLSAAQIARWDTHDNPMLGRKHSEETKNKMSKSWETRRLRAGV